jgi:hypothetical protein
VRSREDVNVASLARAHTEIALRTLVGICQHGESESARVAAAGHILDRGWGRPPQSHAGENGDGPIVVEIVYRNREPEVLQVPAIEHTPIVTGHGRDPERR